MITILGLGPGAPNQLTREAWDVLTQAKTIYLRTRKHPTVAGLPKHLTLKDFDAVYDANTSFENVYARIVSTLIKEAKKRDVIYAVPGHPLVGETTVPMLLARAKALKIKTRIVSGLSFIEPVLEQLAQSLIPNPQSPIDPVNGLQLCDALDLANLHHPPLNPDQPALIAQVYSRAIASDVKLTLMNQYPPLHQLWIVRGDLRQGDRATRPHNHTVPLSHCHTVPLSELDHADHFDHLTSLYVPALPRASGLESLQELMAHLRAPEGCPWDQEQTHQSLRNTMLEEAYEVLTAIDEGDMQALKEELGDLLFNIVFQVQMATEAEVFRMTDVIGEVHAKLIRRHPHVFGEVNTKDTKVISANWEAIKKQEHKAKGAERKSVLDGIPPALPALAQAQKMAHKAEKAGFKYNNNAERMAKVREELDEIMAAKDQANLQEEFGDLFFSLADLADGFGIDAEAAAREANLKFAKRFRALEQLVKRRKQDMNKMTSDDLQAAWLQVKKKLKAQGSKLKAP
jgi:tetrapyrrole methylase family protein/MazG family protein